MPVGWQDQFFDVLNVSIPSLVNRFGALSKIRQVNKANNGNRMLNQTKPILECPVRVATLNEYRAVRIARAIGTHRANKMNVVNEAGTDNPSESSKYITIRPTNSAAITTRNVVAE